jgi:hypothetical protein
MTSNAPVTDVTLEDGPRPEPPLEEAPCPVINGWSTDDSPKIQRISAKRREIESALHYHLVHHYDGAEPEPGFGWSAHLCKLCQLFIELDTALDSARGERAAEVYEHERDEDDVPYEPEPVNEDPYLEEE